MISKILVIIGGLLTFLWGVSHLIPTITIANGVYGILSDNNKNIILMEWVNEGLTLIFIGALVFITAIMNKENNKISNLIYISSSIMLFLMAILSLFTGFKIDFITFKLCPVIFTVSGIMIIQAIERR